jgi:hypothetical protein
MSIPEAAAQYMDSIHGRALLKMGLIVAPSCNDCHGVHDIKRAWTATRPINHANVAKTCGKCHVGIEETYNKSVHGQLLAKGDKRGPVCTIATPRTKSNPNGQFQGSATSAAANATRTGWSITATPTTARPWPWASRTSPRRGRLLRLPRPSRRAAAVQPASHLSKPTSWPPASNVIPGATIGFTEYSRTPIRWTQELSAAPRGVPGMTGLLIGTFTFFGLHTLMWLVRAIYLYLHDSKKFREAKVKTQTDDEWFTRFVPFERFLHFLVVTSFLLLVITGMPLKFYYTDWAKAIFRVIGGAETARTCTGSARSSPSSISACT